MKYMRKYLDEDCWEEISRKELIEKLGRCYRNPLLLIKELDSGKLIATPFAEYKIKVEM